MGDSINEGELKEWTKGTFLFLFHCDGCFSYCFSHSGVGDYVNMDDLVATIETDKVAVEIRAKEPGIIKEQFATPSSTVAVGSPLFSLEGTTR